MGFQVKRAPVVFYATGVLVLWLTESSASKYLSSAARTISDFDKPKSLAVVSSRLNWEVSNRCVTLIGLLGAIFLLDSQTLTNLYSKQLNAQFPYFREIFFKKTLSSWLNLLWSMNSSAIAFRNVFSQRLTMNR